jgi:hypothetical protein
LIYILFELVVSLLAIYGLIMLGFTAAGYMRGRSPGKVHGLVSDCINRTPVRPCVRMILLVRDAEEQIEYIVRTAVKNDFASGVLSDNSLVIIDMNSSDNTYLLLEKLQKDFSNVEAVRFEDRELVFDDFTICSHPLK